MTSVVTFFLKSLFFEKDVFIIGTMDWVIIVDDDQENLTRAAAILEKENIRVTKLSSGEELLNYLEGMSPLPDLILLDIRMNGMDGFETLQALRKELDRDAQIPIVFLTGDEDLQTELTGLRLGAMDFLHKPFLPEILALRVQHNLELIRLQKDLSREVERKSKEKNRLTLHVVQTLAEAIDAKDTYTNGHSGRVASYSKEIAKRLGYDEEQQDEVYIMGLLHDIGKIGVSDQIINKPARLTDEEFAEMKTHPGTGSRILQKIKEMPHLSYGAKWHHERVDGRGYPDGLKGSEIPEEARIIAVADAYDAMTSNRSYRDLMPQASVRSEIERGKGTQFDPRIADVMLAMIDEDTDYTMHEGNAAEPELLGRAQEETVRRMDGIVSLPEELTKISGLDTNLGVFLCGDTEDYLEALSVFASSISSKSQKIHEAFSAGDTETYRTLVHSLKSSARTVGAVVLSDLAKELEDAAKRNDQEKIRKETPRLLSMYRELEESLK